MAVSIFFSAASFAQADTFSIPQQYHYAGLTFSNPLTFTKPLSNPQPTTTIAFSSHHTLMINKNDTQKPIEAIVITPTITPAIATNASITLPQPTPTIYVQSTPILASQEQSISPTPSPTTQPTVTPTTPSYTPTPQANTGGLDAADLFTMVNNYRASLGLPAFQQDTKTCSLAAERAPEVAGEVASGNLHAGLIAMNLPYWNTENIINMNSDQSAFNWWINDPIHHAAIVSNNTYSCVACSGNSCAEEFTSYQPK